MNIIVILQARTNSSRLPAKVLLPLGGLPMVVLAARRAGNTGRHVLVATSNEPDDDALAALLAEHGVDCFRGNLTDTLGRFIAALSDFPDETTVVRLTADNPLPDGRLLDELLVDFFERRLEYLACNGACSGLPYGFSAEVVCLSRLREADRNSREATDREHVTPYVMRKLGASWFKKHRNLRMGHFRCTVDNYDDYQTLLRVFSGEADPVMVPAMRLLEKLKGAPFQPIGPAPVPKLVVGGAQLGMSYGITNRAGKPSPTQVAAMLKCAIANGTKWIDSAHGYSGSEEAIGLALSGGWGGRVQVVTKLATLSSLPQECSPVTVRALVDASVATSLARLRTNSLDALLLHRASHLTDWGGAAWQRMREIAAQSRIRTLGVSVQSPDELEMALNYEDVCFIQMPFNILDWRWDEVVGRLMHERTKRPIVVHARSALLQGLLTSRDHGLWHRANVDKPEEVWRWLSERVAESGRGGLVDLCLAFVRAQQWIDGVVVGMESIEQVQGNIRNFLAPELTREHLLEIGRTRPRLACNTLDPSRWSAA